MKSVPTCLLLAALLLSGCAKTATTDSAMDAPSSSAPTTLVSPPAGPPLLLTVSALAPTQNETVTLTGTLNGPAQLSVGGLTAQMTEGAWSLVVPLTFGHTNLTVVADNGKTTASTKVVAVRLASATFAVKYTAAIPPHAASSDTVWYDPDGRASAFMYTANKTEHPPIASVHDVMVSWTQQTGKRIEYSYSTTYQAFSVSAIDGTGQPLTASAPPYWCYKLNGATADLGLTLQPVAPGDAIVWEFAGCA